MFSIPGLQRIVYNKADSGQIALNNAFQNAVPLLALRALVDGYQSLQKPSLKHSHQAKVSFRSKTQEFFCFAS